MVLHSLETVILEERVEVAMDGFPVAVSGVGYDYDREFLILFTEDTLLPDLPLTINIHFIRYTNSTAKNTFLPEDKCKK